MATNPYYNKVIKGNQTVIDLTADTVTPASVLAGVTFHDASGAACVGTASAGKTIASITPAMVSVPTGDAVLINVSGRANRYDSSSGAYKTFALSATIRCENASSFDVSDYGLINVNPSSSSDNVVVATPAAYVQGTLVMTPEATFDTTDNAWAISLVQNLSTLRPYLQDSAFTSFYGEQPSGSVNIHGLSIDENNSGVYIVEFADGATMTITKASPTAADMNTGIHFVQIDSVVPETVTVPGYLVTYTDNTTESFAAAAADIADGSY